MDLYEKLKEYFTGLAREKGIENEEIEVSFRLLEGIDVLGETSRKDYPLLTGKEKMLEAEFGGAKGQAFTLAGSVFHGTIQDIMKLDLEKEYDRGIFVAALNAVMKHFNLIDGTIHCKGEEPEECAAKFIEKISEKKDKRIAVIGFQPAFIEALAKADFNIRVLDLNPENIGSDRLGVLIEDGVKEYEDVVDWAEVILCTGSTIVNGTIKDYIDLNKDVYFYGNTIAGPAKVLGLNRICCKAV